MPPLDPEVADESAAYDGTGLQEELVIPFAQIQDAHISRKANGATYVTVFEVPLEFLGETAMAGDGHLIQFQGKEVGQGADIRRIGITKDADNNRHVKLSFQFAQSEIIKSIARLGAAIAGESTGELRIVPQVKQQSFDLTAKAE